MKGIFKIYKFLSVVFIGFIAGVVLYPIFIIAIAISTKGNESALLASFPVVLLVYILTFFYVCKKYLKTRMQFYIYLIGFIPFVFLGMYEALYCATVGYCDVIPTATQGTMLAYVVFIYIPISFLLGTSHIFKNFKERKNFSLGKKLRFYAIALFLIAVVSSTLYFFLVNTNYVHYDSDYRYIRHKCIGKEVYLDSYEYDYTSLYGWKEWHDRYRCFGITKTIDEIKVPTDSLPSSIPPHTN